ncbi:unnamed protein product, partial [Ilex paraguariensis]
MGNPHILMISYPAQGHVIPLMELAQCLAQHGFKITFVNTQITHKRVLNAMAGKEILGNQIHLVSIPDGLEEEDRSIPGKLTDSILRVVPGNLEELIKEINESVDDNISCLIADISIGCVLEVAMKMGIRRAAFVPAAATVRVLGSSIPKLIGDGIINNDGTPTKNQTIQLS